MENLVEKVVTVSGSSPVQPSPSPVSKPSGIASGSIAAAVNAGLGTKVPKGVTTFNTRSLDTGYFHGMLYGETSSWKTSTAATFGGPANTLFILTRSPEQMIPLREQGFNVARVEDGDALAWTLQFPEKAADAAGMPEWKDNPNRILVIDDMTQGANYLVENNETDESGRERKDGRQIYKGVNDDLNSLLASLKRKQMHLIFTALARVALSPIQNEETIAPEMPNGAKLILTGDLEYVFFLDKQKKKMLTDESSFQFEKKDERGNKVMGRRRIFAKNKLPLGVPKGTLNPEETPNLAELWKRIKEAKVPR